ncbi:MAG: metal-dependent hydrolase, partial [Bacteroidota bacterium]
MDLEQLRYPIGRYNPTDPFSEEQFSDEIEVLKDFHSKLEKLVMTLSYDKLQFKYHHMSWSIIQLVHHLSDSHMHAYIRTKNILTNEKPSVQ